MAPKRNRISEIQRKEIREWWRSQDPHPRHKTLAEWFQQKYSQRIHQSTVTDCLSSKYDYLDEIDASTLSQLRPAYRSRQSQWPILEDLLAKWHESCAREGHKATGEMLVEKAKELFSQIPEYQGKQLPEFSNGWLSGFRERHMLVTPRKSTILKREQAWRDKRRAVPTTTAAPLSSLGFDSMPELDPPAVPSMPMEIMNSESVPIQRPSQRLPAGLQQSSTLESASLQPAVNSSALDTTEEALSMRILCRVYKDEDIFSMSETILSWRKAPLSSLQSIQKQNSKIALMMCTNQTGNDRFPLWIIGNTTRARSLSNLNIEALGGCWRSSRKGAEIEPNLIKEWLLKFYEHIGKERSVLLLLDRQIVSHTVGLELAPPPANIRIQWLPSSSTSPSPFQPFDHGISRSLKLIYRRQWLQYILKSKRQSTDPFATVSLYHAVHWAINAWLYEISSTSIHNCFTKAISATKPTSGNAFLEASAPNLEPLYDEMKRLFVKNQQDGREFNAFLNSDEENFARGLSDTQQNAIRQRRLAEENEESDLAPTRIPTFEQALQSVQVLMCYKEHQSDTTRSDMQMLEQWKRELLAKTRVASYS